MQSNVRDPKVRNLQFVALQPTLSAEEEPPVTVAIFREDLPRIPPNLPQPTPVLLCRIRDDTSSGALWGRAYWNGRSYVPSSFIREPTTFVCGGQIETITQQSCGNYLAVGDAINDDIASPVAALEDTT